MPDDFVLRPEDSVNEEGCPILTKTRVILGIKGLCSTIEWVVRNASGQAVNLGNLLCADSDGDSVYDESESEPDSEPYPLCGQVVFRFADAICPSEVWQAVGYSPDPEAGVVRVDLPAGLVEYAGVYRLEVAVSEQIEPGVYKIRLIDSGLVSIERSLFGLVTPDALLGAPTIREIRIALRDSGLENSLLQDVEFDDAEITQAIARPLRQWNETPPPIAYFDSRSFPFHEHWLKATMAILMRSAAYWYERNRLSTSAGGIPLDDRNKMQTYMLMADRLYKEWEVFVIDKKVSINAARVYGIVSSPY